MPSAAAVTIQVQGRRVTQGVCCRRSQPRDAGTAGYTVGSIEGAQHNSYRTAASERWTTKQPPLPRRDVVTRWGRFGADERAWVVSQAVFLGTEAFPTAEHLKARLAALGMSFGADSNAFTDFRQTVYTLNCCLDPGSAAAAAATTVDDEVKSKPSRWNRSPSSLNNRMRGNNLPALPLGPISSSSSRHKRILSRTSITCPNRVCLCVCVCVCLQEDALSPPSKRGSLSTRAPLSSPPRRSSVAGGSGSGTHASPPPRRRTRLQAAQQQSHALSAALDILFELAFKVRVCVCVCVCGVYSQRTAALLLLLSAHTHSPSTHTHRRRSPRRRWTRSAARCCPSCRRVTHRRIGRR